MGQIKVTPFVNWGWSCRAVCQGDYDGLQSLLWYWSQLPCLLFQLVTDEVRVLNLYCQMLHPLCDLDQICTAFWTAVIVVYLNHILAVWECYIIFVRNISSIVLNRWNVLFCAMYTVTQLLHKAADFVPELGKVMSKIWTTRVPDAILSGCPTEISGSLIAGWCSTCTSRFVGIVASQDSEVCVWYQGWC